MVVEGLVGDATVSPGKGLPVDTRESRNRSRVVSVCLGHGRCHWCPLTLSLPLVSVRWVPSPTHTTRDHPSSRACRVPPLPGKARSGALWGSVSSTGEPREMGGPWKGPDGVSSSRGGCGRVCGSPSDPPRPVRPYLKSPDPVRQVSGSSPWSGSRRSVKSLDPAGLRGPIGGVVGSGPFTPCPPSSGRSRRVVDPGVTKGS